MKFGTVKIIPPDGVNMMIGQSHFIKSVEDIYEALVNSVPMIKFGLAFCESSGKCLIRHEGNDDELRKLASETAFKLSSGHAFVVFIKNSYPINVLNRIKEVPEVCNVYCATANPVEVVLVETDQGRGIIGVIDGFKSKGIEGDEEIKERKEFLRKIGYKL
ncbi:MAG: adenosine-specific kinase [Candidatus Methylarchaceae archaeon HK02M1]|nr:adenosine-specific kinase [Candidatus Methylarchaceae archaeon HK01M]MCP8312580.1 adenosine-specific kinase [Candidatus Methylarchaceae archaeon HK02M1]